MSPVPSPGRSAVSLSRVVRRAAAEAAVIAMRVAVRVLPPARIAVVHGFPDSEENSLRCAAELARTLPTSWRTVLLCDDIPAVTQAYRLALPDAPGLIMVRRWSARGYLLAARARLWVHTHGLYGSPRGSRGRMHVLVGHGHGPKRATRRQGGTHRHHADLAFTNVAVWGTTIIGELGVTPSTPIVVTASPRSDSLVVQHNNPDPTEAFGQYVLWLPTVRRTVPMLRAQWSDGVPVTEQEGLAAQIALLREAVSDRGLELVTKVHELDADAAAFNSLGVRVVTSAELAAAGITFQQFVASSAALITDYSSVFVDHLQTALPVGFWIPDEGAFDDDRGFNEPDFREVAPELLLRTDADMINLLDHVAAGEQWQPVARERLARRIGHVAGTGSATATVVEEILRRGHIV